MARKLTKRRGILLGAIAIVAAILLTLFLAPGRNLVSSGSTYSRSPDGYGAWYAYMAKRGTPVQRWQRPLKALKNREAIALLQVRSTFELQNLSPETRAWLDKGNTLVILGQWQPVTAAPFTSILSGSRGESVKIETRRRASDKNLQTPLLRDRFGAVVWEEAMGEGRAIWVTTPHLAANAYQNERGNYEFLARLLTETGQTIWVDEYLHGYRDPNAEAEEETVSNAFDYLMRTPLLPILLQSAIVFLVAIIGLNFRFGRPQSLETPEENNSQAYIQALAGVLEKAQSSEFVIKTIGQAEQIALQRRLGLGATPLEPEALLAAWQAQTGRNTSELRALLKETEKPRSRTYRELLSWLEHWSQVNREEGMIK